MTVHVVLLDGETIDISKSITLVGCKTTKDVMDKLKELGYVGSADSKSVWEMSQIVMYPYHMIARVIVTVQQ